MPDSWKRALNRYLYPVYLCRYHRRNEFPGFFEISISGDRRATIAFENHFRETSANNIAAFFEVVFWKLYSQPLIRQGTTDRIVDFVIEHKISSMDLWVAVFQFVESQTMGNLRKIRELLGITTKVIAIPLTFPSLACPERIPMIDKQVAKWVNMNGAKHSTDTNNKLTEFSLNYTSLRENDFNSYLSWIIWCQEISDVLARLTMKKWRARDVEMAVFTAQRMQILLNPIN